MNKGLPQALEWRERVWTIVIGDIDGSGVLRLRATHFHRPQSFPVFPRIVSKTREASTQPVLFLATLQVIPAPSVK